MSNVQPKPLVVITGASSGIGEATAKLMASKGHPLLLLARRLERMEALALGPHVLCRRVDVTDRAAVAAAVAEAEAIYGPTDLLVNNAGLMQLGAVSTQDPAEWDAMIDVNVKGVLNCSRAVVPAMQARQGGTIINISSVAGRKTFGSHVTYCGTKFAVHAITEGLREELAPHNVRVLVVAPGATETELLGHTNDAAVLENYNSWKRAMVHILRSEDVADAIAYAYGAPQSVSIREIVLCATKQAR